MRILQVRLMYFDFTVQEALTEANDALTRQGLKRDLMPFHES